MSAIFFFETFLSQDAAKHTTDAINDFNSLNRRVALHNIQISSPSSNRIICLPSRMIILYGSELQSSQGTTQGYNLAMPFYALSTVQIHRVFIFIFADSYASGAGSLKFLKNWQANIVKKDSRLSYYVNEKKSWLTLKNETLIETANNLVTNIKNNIIAECKRHLGVAISSNEFRVEYVTEKVDDWTDELRPLSLSKIATSRHIRCFLFQRAE